MLSQFEDMIINTLVQKLNSHGINVDSETLKKAISNSPQLVQQVESVLLASTSQERLEKIKTLITQAAAKGEPTTANQTETSKK